MLLTLSATSLASRFAPKGADLALDDLPQYAVEVLGLHGLNFTAGMLAGMDHAALERLRERADRAGCAVLLLHESAPLAFADPAAGDAAIERVRRVARAAQVLGCTAAGIACAGEDAPGVFEGTVERLRTCLGIVERMELNLLISPGPGLTASPERVTELIKKVGGFRIGTYPDFEAAAASADPVAYLRRLTPYASVVRASTRQFVHAKTGKPAGDKPETPVRHSPYDLAALVRALTSVGYDGTLAIEYRGAGDATLGVIRSRDALTQALA
jgi:sugar phosphate isomerase/epimerase